MMEVKFRVPCIPVAQPRQRITTIAGHAHGYTPARHPVNAFKSAVQVAATKAYNGAPFDGPLVLVLTCILPRPKSKMKKRGGNPPCYATTKPDLDNLMKSIADALNGILWRDDKQIAEVSMTKTVAAGNEQAGVEIQVGVLDDETLADSWRNYGKK